MTYQVIESTHNDGRKTYRFVEGNSKRAVKFAREQANRFAIKAGVRDTRVFEASDDEVAKLRNPTVEAN